MTSSTRSWWCFGYCVESGLSHCGTAWELRRMRWVGAAIFMQNVCFTWSCPLNNSDNIHFATEQLAARNIKDIFALALAVHCTARTRNCLKLYYIIKGIVRTKVRVKECTVAVCKCTLTLWSSNCIILTTCCNIQKLCVVPTQCFYMWNFWCSHSALLKMYHPTGVESSYTNKTSCFLCSLLQISYRTAQDKIKNYSMLLPMCLVAMAANVAQPLWNYWCLWCKFLFPNLSFLIARADFNSFELNAIST
jgi:hypothetical protein